MDAATMGAVMAALPTQKTIKSVAGEAIAIAVELLKPSYHTARILATALKRAIWTRTARDLAPTLARAGERMMLYEDLRRDYQAALNAVLQMEYGYRWDTPMQWQEAEDTDEVKQTRMRLYTAEIAMKLAREEKACEEYGSRRTEWLQVLADVDEMGDRIRVYPVCRARIEGHKSQGESSICGLSFPSCMWTKSEYGHEYICQVNWAAFEKKLCTIDDDDPIHAWASQMRSKHGPTHNWPKVGCGAYFYPTWEDSTCVVEVRREDTGQWVSFAADPPPMAITDEINLLMAQTIPEGPQRGSEGWTPRGWGEVYAPLCPPHTHLYQDYPIIARYPLEAWELTNRPNLSARGWSKVALSLAMNIDPPNPEGCKLLKAFDLTRGPKQRTIGRTTQVAGDSDEETDWPARSMNAGADAMA